jgi:hypothetical protein
MAKSMLLNSLHRDHRGLSPLKRKAFFAITPPGTAAEIGKKLSVVEEVSADNLAIYFIAA